MSSSINSSEPLVRAVAILVDGPMQAWGATSRFTHRETEAFPTKSALLGLIAAAIGVDKDSPLERGKISELGTLRLTVFSIPRARLVQRISDFHTVGGGYEPKVGLFDKLSIPNKASGGPSANAVLTHRSYLNDARFLACFEGEASIISQITESLENPVWGGWFGRKNCVPSMPLCPQEGNTIEESASKLLKLLQDWEKNSTISNSTDRSLDALDRWVEPRVDTESPCTFYLHDQPVSFGPREYQSRPIQYLPGKKPAGT